MVFAVALLASLAVHLPVYEVLGELRDRLFAEDEARRKSVPIEFELTSTEVEPPIAAPVADVGALEPVVPVDVKPEPSPRPNARVKVERTPVAEAPSPLAAPKPKPEPVPTPQPAPTVPTPPIVADSRQSVIQRSADPSVEAPPNAKYLADQNQRVEEETAASVTNMQQDSEETQLGAPRNSEAQEAGDANETEVADTRDVNGEEDRIATPEEAQRPTPALSSPSAGSRSAEAHPQSMAAASSTTRPTLEQREAGDPTAGGEPATIAIDDGFGTIQVRNPRAAGQGAGADGGQHRPGEHAHAQGAQRGVSGHAGGSPLTVSWSQFEEVFGSDQLREQREAYADQRRSQTRGGHRDREWTRFRSAIENFLPSVRPGNQTALNAAAAPFASYLVMVHERIHREYAFKFIRGLLLTSGPFSDPSLFTELELVFNRNGSVHRIGVVRPSGFLPFDFGAYSAVMRAQPFPEAPPSILSGDGRVYIHWGFYRNERQCGTFNASPFILPNPPGTPALDQDPLRDMTPPPVTPSAPPEVPPDGTYGFNTHR